METIKEIWFWWVDHYEISIPLFVGLISYIYSKWITRKVLRRSFEGSINRALDQIANFSTNLEEFSINVDLDGDESSFTYMNTDIGAVQVTAQFSFTEIHGAYTSGFIWPWQRSNNGEKVSRLFSDTRFIESLNDFANSKFSMYRDTLNRLVNEINQHKLEFFTMYNDMQPHELKAAAMGWQNKLLEGDLSYNSYFEDLITPVKKVSLANQQILGNFYSWSIRAEHAINEIKKLHVQLKNDFSNFAEDSDSVHSNISGYIENMRFMDKFKNPATSR